VTGEPISCATAALPSLPRLRTWTMPDRLTSDDMSYTIRDVDHDGDFELVASRTFTQYEGAVAAMAVFPTVYKCSAEGCTDVSSTQLAFYYDELSMRQAELTKLEAQVGPGLDLRRLPAVRMEIDKLLRFTGAEPDAGFRLAQQWMTGVAGYESPTIHDEIPANPNGDPMRQDEVIKSWAMYIFADIDDAASRRELEAMTHDADSLIAKLARVTLERLTRKTK
jgi:hypothetical protein